MLDWQTKYAAKLATAEAAVSGVKSGQRVFIGSGAAVPSRLVKALSARGPELSDTQIVHIMTLGDAPYTAPDLREGFRHNAFFIGKNVRDAIASGRGDYTPIFLSELPRLFQHGSIPIDWALIQVSPPDEHGYCSYGVSVDVVKSASESAQRVVALVNPRMPRTLGDSFIHVDRIHALVAGDDAIIEHPAGVIDDVSRRIGQNIADLIVDGSTLQLGIGTIPDAVLAALGGKKDLGIHTEMFSDGVIELVQKGVINGARKNIHPGKIVASFVLGTRKLYDFIDNNPLCEFHPTEYVNDPFRVSRNDRMIAINSALQVDLTGQVCADSIGEYFYSGIGGQVDFMRGAARSKDGKAIIALPATAKSGQLSRIVPVLTPGAGVVTTRGDVHYVVTEFGVAYLHGKTIRERAIALIHIAHPKFRDKLMEEARSRKIVYGDQVDMRAAGEPELRNLVSTVATKDGRTVRFRPAHPTDEEMMREFFYKLSPETVYHRFFSNVKAMPHAKLKEFVGINYATDMALVGVVTEDEHEMIVAVGRYSLDMSTNAAEVAFVVADAWQGRGLGSHLLKQLMQIARQRGIVRFTADVLGDNAAMLHLFHKYAPTPVKTVLDSGVYQLSFSIEVPGATTPPKDADA
ncbi:MAG TPA: GNAT family N-acetyltransferase [Planctomycetota bacterium]|nr:GNAT family N-acetyltransferase [Planctomycetota bacterium]